METVNKYKEKRFKISFNYVYINLTKMSVINVEFFQNIGMLKLDFNLHPLKLPINNFFYSVYGNSGFTLKGAFDISSLKKEEYIPSLFFKTRVNNIYFIKVKFGFNGEEKEEFKMIDLTRVRRKNNINMNILDRSVEELFKSINLGESNYDSDNNDNNSDNNNDNDSDNNNDNGSDNNNDNDSNNNDDNDSDNNNDNDSDNDDNDSDNDELNKKLVIEIKNILSNKTRSLSVEEIVTDNEYYSDNE